MPTAEVNGVQLFYEVTGRGEVPLLLVHGSWGSHDNWNSVVPELATSLQVIAYDRRGHSASQRPVGQGSVLEDVADAAALIEHLGIQPAWVMGNSFGASISLRLAGARSELLRGLVVHEPPLFSLVSGDAEPSAPGGGDEDPMAVVLERIAAGDHDGAAELFVDAVAIGPGTWKELPPEMKETFVRNAPTFLDECRDPDQFMFDLGWIRDFIQPSLVTHGGASPPPFTPVVEALAAALPNCDLLTLPSAGHIPHVTHAHEFAEIVRDFIQRNS